MIQCSGHSWIAWNRRRGVRYCVTGYSGLPYFACRFSTKLSSPRFRRRRSWTHQERDGKSESPSATRPFRPPYCPNLSPNNTRAHLTLTSYRPATGTYVVLPPWHVYPQLRMSEAEQHQAYHKSIPILKAARNRGRHRNPQGGRRGHQIPESSDSQTGVVDRTLPPFFPWEHQIAIG